MTKENIMQNSLRNISTAMALTAKENNRYSLSMTLSWVHLADMVGRG